MDDIDRAQAREAQDRALALAVRKPQLKPCGVCYNCNELVSGNAEFCDSDCRADYEVRESARMRAGR